MKLYDDSVAQPVRLAFEEKVRDWAGLLGKKMMGCPCYDGNGKMFAFLVTEGIVLTNLAPDDQEVLAQAFGAVPFQPDERRTAVKKWSQIPIESAGQLEALLPYIRRSYEAASRKAAQPAPPKRPPSRTTR